MMLHGPDIHESSVQEWIRLLLHLNYRVIRFLLWGIFSHMCLEIIILMERPKCQFEAFHWHSDIHLLITSLIPVLNAY